MEEVDEPQIIRQGFDPLNTDSNAKALLRFPLFSNIILHDESVFSQAITMLENAFNPMRLMSTELYLYQDSGKIIEGPLLEMELWLKIIEFVNTSKNDLKDVIKIQPMVLSERLEATSKMKPRTIVNPEQIVSNKPNLPVNQIIGTTTVNDPPQPKKQRIDVKYNKTQPRKDLLGLWKVQGYAMSYKTMKVYLKNIYIDYIDLKLQPYLRPENIGRLKKLIDDLILKLTYFYTKYHGYIVGKDEKGGKGSFLRKGVTKRQSIGPEVLQPDRLNIYVFENKQWGLFASLSSVIMAPDDEVILNKVLDLENKEKEEAIQKEIQLVKQQEDDLFNDYDDSLLLGEFARLCLKCLKLCE